MCPTPSFQKSSRSPKSVDNFLSNIIFSVFLVAFSQNILPYPLSVLSQELKKLLIRLGRANHHWKAQFLGYKFDVIIFFLGQRIKKNICAPCQIKVHPSLKIYEKNQSDLITKKKVMPMFILYPLEHVFRVVFTCVASRAQGYIVMRLHFAKINRLNMLVFLI